jgi:hypothetical protein
MKMAEPVKKLLKRNKPGTKANVRRNIFFSILAEFNFDFSWQSFRKWPDEPFEEMESTLAVQEFIQQQIRKDPSAIDIILTPPDSQEEGVWKYEHLR